MSKRKRVYRFPRKLADVVVALGPGEDVADARQFRSMCAANHEEIKRLINDWAGTCFGAGNVHLAWLQIGSEEGESDARFLFRFRLGGSIGLLNEDDYAFWVDLWQSIGTNDRFRKRVADGLIDVLAKITKLCGLKIGSNILMDATWSPSEGDRLKNVGTGRVPSNRRRDY